MDHLISLRPLHAIQIGQKFYSVQLGQRPSDRSNVITQVYLMKLEDLLHDIRSGIIFGPCIASK
jgi:hypothetical protein